MLTEQAPMIYDAIVLGLGAMGGAAIHHLARREAKVLGLEQFQVGHARGSSHGETRVIRKAYFEHPDYVPLLQRAYDLWHELEGETGQRLFEDGVGLVMIGPPDCEALTGTLAVARQHGLPIEPIERPPGLVVPEGMSAIWDGEGGILYVERCVVAHVEAARRHGAEVREGVEVLGWRRDGDGVVVRSATDEWRARRLVVTGGAWSQRLVADLGVPMRVLRKVVFWYPERTPGTCRLGKLPIFLYALPYGRVYGFPSLDEHGVKMADHLGGQVLENPDPDPGVLPGDEDSCLRAVRELFPQLLPERTRHTVCLYTMTPDENFLVGLHPQDDRIVVAAGFSGHGFKFATVMGEILADLALEGRTAHPIDFLSPTRFASR